MGKRGKRADHQGDESNQESDYTILSDNEDLYSYLKSDEREPEALPAKENTGKEFVYSDADDDNEISDYEVTHGYQETFPHADHNYDYRMEDDDDEDDELFGLVEDDREEQQAGEPLQSTQISPNDATASDQFPPSSTPPVSGNAVGASSQKGPLKCRFSNCNESFIHKTALIVHERSHTGEKIYTCNYPDCNKQFHQRSYLKYHEQTHLTNSVFKCDAPGCTKQYRSRYTLISHKREHTGEKPFICDVAGCEKAFSQRYQWISHKKLHEPNGVDSEDGEDKSGCESDQLKGDHHDEATEGIVKKRGRKVVKVEEEEEVEEDGDTVNPLKRSHQQNVEEGGEKRKRFRRKCDWIKCEYPGCRKKFRYPKILRKHMLSHTKIKEEHTSSTAEDPKRVTMLLKTENISEFEVTKFVSKNSSAENGGLISFESVNHIESTANGTTGTSTEMKYMSDLTQFDRSAAEEKNSDERIDLVQVEKSLEGKELKHLKHLKQLNQLENWISLDDDNKEIIDTPSQEIMEAPDYFV